MSFLHESESSDPEAGLALLLRASELLGRSLDYDVTLSNLATLLVPRMADGYILDLVEGDEIRRLAAVDRDPANAPLMEKLKQLGAVNPKAPHGIQKILESGTPLFSERLTDEGLQKGARSPEHLAILRALGLYSGLTVPLKARGRAIGLLWLYYSQSRRTYTQGDLALAEEIAARAALAIDNARLFRELEDAVRSRDDFLAIASHELRTPITSLLLRAQGFTRNLERHPSEEPTREDVLTWLRLFNAHIQRMARLVEEMLDVSRMTAGRLQLAPTRVDLGLIVRETATNMDEALRRARCGLTIDAPLGIDGMWDRTRIEQVVQNLLTNAMKYGEGKPIAVRLSRHEDVALLEVQDEGIGIDPKHLERIFERFERVVSSRNYGGLGLGLWIARQIVEASGGTIRAESAAGRGSTFRVELPIRAD